MKRRRAHFFKPLFRFFLMALTGGAVFLAVPQTAPAIHPGENTKNILVLNSCHDGYAWSDGIMAGIRSVFSHKPNTNLMVEYVDNDSAHKPISP